MLTSQFLFVTLGQRLQCGISVRVHLTSYASTRIAYYQSYRGVRFLQIVKFKTRIQKRTCQSTVYHVTLSNKEPCALMVENNV